MNPDWRARYETLIRVAQEAGRHALSYYPDCQAAKFADKVIWKGDNSPVTVADREAESLLREKLLAQFPGDGFLGEEFGETPSSTGYRWIVDPIDGTRSFVRGVPHWATLAALEYRGEAIAGVAYEPVIDRLWRALRGEGTYRGDTRVHVSSVNRLDESSMFYSSLWWFMKAGMQDAFIELVKQTQRQRGFGDYYGFLLVAQGAGEFMVEHGVKEWDIAALKVIIEEAGGRFSDWDGSPTTRSPHCLASNGKVHDAVLTILQRPP
jgi:histidinol-phosphatase